MDRLRAGCKELGIILSENQEKQFKKYYELLLDWNQRINLTAITDYEEVVNKHFLDSLCLVRLPGILGKEKMKVIDVGTGAGFPGIPLKIVFPEMHLTLLDSLNKRIKFLETLIDQLELDEVTAIHGRAEELGRKKDYREKFDLCVSRAVAHLSVLSEYCIPLIDEQGKFTAYKSGSVQNELHEAEKAVKILGGSIKEKINFKIPNTDMSRTLICIEKEHRTPEKYPRKSGMPGKSPLI